MAESPGGATERSKVYAAPLGLGSSAPFHSPSSQTHSGLRSVAPPGLSCGISQAKLDGIGWDCR
jgi:hypothetical protein